METYCIPFEEPSITGVELLQRSGVTTIVDPSSSFGQAVCKIDGEGCDYPLEDCFCQCQNLGENCVYWAYYHLVDGQWEYSGEGAGTYRVHDGDVEGWAWGPGTAGSGTEPPVIPFDQICPTGAEPSPTPTASPTPTPTYTPPATNTPTPSPTATPTPTPSPTPCMDATCSPLSTPTYAPVLYTFTADRVRLPAGECTTLRWDTEGATEVILRLPQGDLPVAARGTQEVCLTQTTNYLLVMRGGTEELKASLTITVLPIPSPTIAPVSSFTPAPVASPTPTPTATPFPAFTPTQVQSSMTDTPTAIPTTAVLPEPSPTPPPVGTPTVNLPPHAQIVTPPRPLPYKLRQRTPTPAASATPTTPSRAQGADWTHGWRAYALTLVLLALVVLWTYRRGKG